MSYYTPGSQHYAHQAVNRAVKSGTLAKSSTCEECGKQRLTSAHHHKGYGEEYALDVIWLCHSCHAKIHGVPESLKVREEFPELQRGGRPTKLRPSSDGLRMLDELLNNLRHSSKK